MPLDIATVMITGGTGSLGQALTRFLLEHTQVTIRVFSRDELKQSAMRDALQSERVRYLLGDVRDRDRLMVAMRGVKYVVHAAALKQIDALEYNPTEAVKTNIDGTANVIAACQACDVRKAVFVGTDKEVHSINMYGHCKAVASRLWIRANAYSPTGTSFVAIRYGNVSGSRGSVIPRWRQQLQDGQPLTITDSAMTRFHISLAEAVQLAWFALNHAPRGSLLVPHLSAYSVKTLAQAVIEEAVIPWERVTWQSIGIRPGEKLHETLLTDEEAARVVTYTEDGAMPLYYCVPAEAPSWRVLDRSTWGGKGTWEAWPFPQLYRSDTWPAILVVEALRKIAQEVP